MDTLRKISRRDRANQAGFDEFGFEITYAFGYEKREYHAKRKRAKEREKERKRYDKHRASERRIFTTLQRIEVYERDNGICQICGCSVTFEYYECDHIRPWSKGGQTTVQNAQCTCRTCNRSKSAKHE
jgi:5-methylcytosine-specific restriction endonuclease McrA